MKARNERAAKHFLQLEQPVLRIQEQHREHFVSALCQLQAHIFLDLGRRIEHRPLAELLAQRAPCQFDHGADLGALGRTQPFD